MATYFPGKRATAHRFTICLYDQSTGQIKTTPTLAAGDVKVSKDNGALANITTLPTEAPASSGILQVDLSATEMTADLVTVLFRDAAGAEWNDVAVHIPTTARQIDDLAYPATSGRSITVDASGNANANLVNIEGAAVSTSTAQLGVNVVNAAGTAWGSGAITAASIASNAITASKINTDAIGSTQLAASAATEISAAVWAAAVRTLTANTNLNDLSAADVRAAVGLASANLDTQIGAIDDFLDTEIAAIKAKTDSLTFTVAGQVDANVQYVNDVQVTGTGAAGDEWGP